MTPHSHLDHFHAHARTQGSKKRSVQTTHCRAYLFKSQEPCLSFPYILLAETFGSERRCFLFFSPPLFAVCICTYMTSACSCQAARFIDLNNAALYDSMDELALHFQWREFLASLSPCCLTLTCVSTLSHPLPSSLVFFFCLCSSLSSPRSSSSPPPHPPLTSVLQLRLQQRRTQEQLADQGIMPRE